MQRWLYILLLVGVIRNTSAGTDPVFIANRKQWPEAVQFVAPISQGNVLFFQDRVQFALHTPYDHHQKGHSATASGPRADNGASTETPVYGHMYEVRFVGAQPTTPHGEQQLSVQYNYFLGNDRSAWASNVPAYNSIHYCGLYTGIDMRYHAEGPQMKYEWIVGPHANPDSIRMAYRGANSIAIEENRLRIETSIGKVWDMEPYAYQWRNGVRVEVPCVYRLQNNVVSYAFPEGYDTRYELIIDPLLIFSAYSGSTLDNWGNTATYDEHGNVYSGGMVWGGIGAHGFPTTPGAYQVNHRGDADATIFNWDIGILKYDSSGSQLLYCTYLGGTGTDTPHSLVVNPAGDLLVLGTTGSNDFPVTNGSVFKKGIDITPLGGVEYPEGSDLFVARLSENGSILQGSTYLGGSDNDGINLDLARNYGDEQRSDIIAGADNAVYIVSNTSSADFPVVGTGATFQGGGYDAVVARLAPDLSSIVWSRCVGGTNPDAAYSVRIDPTSGNIFVAGGSTSTTITGMNGRFVSNRGNVDGWVMSFTPNGDIVNGTFIGTPQYDQAYFLDLDLQGKVYVYGQTKGAYPVTNGVYTNPQAGQFVQQLDNALLNPGFSTVVGKGNRTPDISPTAFLVSDCGYMYLGGWGGQTNVGGAYVGGNTFGLPVTTDAYQATTAGNDFYFMVLSSDASQLLYATFLGGRISRTHVDGGTSRFDKRGIVYQAVCAGCPACFGCSPTSDFPAVNVPAAHRRNASNNCNNLVFKFDLSLLKARVRSNSEQFDTPGLVSVCMPDKIAFENFTTGGKEYHWDLGDGTQLVLFDKAPVIHQYKTTGTYTVTLKAIDPGTCQGEDAATVVVSVYNADADIQDDDNVCQGASYQLKASGGATYSWRSRDGSFTSNQASPIIAPADSTIYYITVTESTGCIHRDTVQINVIPSIAPEFEIDRQADCFKTPSVTVRSLTDSLREGDRLFFDFGDGTTADTETVTHAYEKDGQYTVKLVAVRESCVNEKTVTMPFLTLKVPNVITPGQKDGRNDHFDIQFGPQAGVTPGDYGFKVSLIVYNRWGSEVYRADDYKYDWSGEGLAEGIYFYDVTVAGHTYCKSWVHIIR